MPSRTDRTAFRASPEQLACWPDVSGNEINGVGEADVRRPTPIMWHDSSRLAHGRVQDWFWAQGVREPALAGKRAERQRIIDQPMPPVAADRSKDRPERNAEQVRKLARESGADVVGLTRVRPEWVFEGYDFDYAWAVILGVAMDHDRLATAPEVTAALEVVDKYTKGWIVSRPVALWIRSQGWRAEPAGGPMAGPLNLIPAAIECGFGELGKHGSMINREYGSSFRLAAVFTDMPLVQDAPDEFAADDFCTGCQVCTQACPVDAISNSKQLVRGVIKWYVDFDACLEYFAETYGCGICLAVCPWSKPGRAPVLAQRWTARRERGRE